MKRDTRKDFKSYSNVIVLGLIVDIDKMCPRGEEKQEVAHCEPKSLDIDF